MATFLEHLSVFLSSSQGTSFAVLIAGPYLLVGLRFWGLFQTAPLVSTPVVSWQMRLLLSGVLAGVVAPLVDTHIAQDRTSFTATGAAALVELLWCGGAEVLLGATLGLGVRVVLSGLQLAGTLIDQQSGLAISQVLNPVSEETESITGHLFLLLGGAVFLLMTPTGGDLLLVRGLLESFDRLPIGSPMTLEAPVSFVQDVVLQAFLLSIQVAAPLLAVMSLLTIAIAYMARSSGHFGLPAAFVPLRIVVCFAFLLTAMPGIAERTSDVIAAVTEAAPSAVSEGAVTDESILPPSVSQPVRTPSRGPHE